MKDPSNQRLVRVSFALSALLWGQLAHAHDPEAQLESVKSAPQGDAELTGDLLVAIGLRGVIDNGINRELEASGHDTLWPVLPSFGLTYRAHYHRFLLGLSWRASIHDPGIDPRTTSDVSMWSHQLLFDVGYLSFERACWRLYPTFGVGAAVSDLHVRLEPREGLSISKELARGDRDVDIAIGSWLMRSQLAFDYVSGAFLVGARVDYTVSGNVAWRRDRQLVQHPPGPPTTGPGLYFVMGGVIK